MIDKPRVKELFQKLKRLSEERKPFVICERYGFLTEHDLDPEKYNDLQRSFMDTKTINGLTICEMREVFTVDSPTMEFDSPLAKEVKFAVMKHFENADRIVLRVRDNEGFTSLYYYTKDDIGNPSDIIANHDTIFFATGRCFYVKNLKSIAGVGEILLN